MRFTTRSWRCAGLAGLLVLVCAGTGRADLIFLKDGFVLQGHLWREGKEEVDPFTHQPFFVPKGFYALDDYARRIYFSPTQVRLVQPKDLPREDNVVKETPRIVEPRNLPPFTEVLKTTPFEENWERSIKLRTAAGDITLRQRVCVITPSLTTMFATQRFGWASFYMTRELGPDALRELLTEHPKFKIKKGEPDKVAVGRRLKYCDFFVQAGWYDEAERELDRLTKSYPEFKGRIEEARALLGGLLAREALDEVRRRVLAGQRQTALQKIETFPKKYAAPKVLADLREIQTELDVTEGRLRQVRKFLEEFASELKGANKDALTAAAEAIRNDLHAEHLERLEAFLGQAARQAARLKEDGKKPNRSPEQLLSLAVTGWLLGNSLAEAKPETALKLWRARQLVLDYQRTAEAADRRKLLDGYLKESSQAVGIDEIAQLIPTLPPPEAAEKVDTKPIEMTIGVGRAAIKYTVQLPPEYTHGRPWPVLVVLHGSGEAPADMIKRWSQMAADNGYILAAPAWESGGLRGGYNFTVQEHRTVLETLRDLRRRFQVDSDRVFLYGLAAGGVMAFDVGLSHPDQFAGLMPMGGGPELFAGRYFRNAQHLPIYSVNGDKAGDTKSRPVFENWTGRGYPTLWVTYKGRGAEWFSAELPNLFEWMRDKRRAFPLRQLGTDGNRSVGGNEFSSLRQTDNRFYWLSTEQIADRHLASPERWDPRVPLATFYGRIDPVSNEITLSLSGLKQVTIWLGRSAKGENMIDFDKPLLVRANLRILTANRKVPMSLETLLEDLYQRGDKQRLFLARLDFKL